MISQKEIIEDYLKFEKECKQQKIEAYEIIRWLFEVWVENQDKQCHNK